MTATTPQVKYQKKDFQTDQEVRWCPGCGDYAILNAVQTAFANLGIPKHRFVVVSGIGCSSRLPYYVNTYGFHSIHGRAPAVATGVKIANPELQVWVGTGDGDALSIGGNHILHAMRRNADIKVLLFNNRIYGLTKGQYSPTSELGKINKSAPYGTVDRPINPVSIALASGATFIARSVDVYARHLQEIITRAAQHKGAAFIEIFQNCNVFNDNAFDSFTTREVRDDQNVLLEHGKPLVFGKNRDKGLRIRNNLEVEVVTLGQNGVTEKDLIVHDEKNAHAGYAFLISRLVPPEFPMPLGVLRSVEMPTLDERIHAQIDEAKKKLGEGDLKKLLHSGDTWVVS
jgi:2-oxoglutarate ferredoxin oxidoreductase subunit beta